jgi:hypothetical protein
MPPDGPRAGPREPPTRRRDRSALPRGTDCNPQTGTCAWYRRFQSGFVVYNPSLDTKVRKVSLPVTVDGSCRQVSEVRGQNITSGKCVKSLAVNVSPGQGRIFTLAP